MAMVGGTVQGGNSDTLGGLLALMKDPERVAQHLKDLEAAEARLETLRQDIDAKLAAFATHSREHDERERELASREATLMSEKRALMNRADDLDTGQRALARAQEEHAEKVRNFEDGCARQKAALDSAAAFVANGRVALEDAKADHAARVAKDAAGREREVEEHARSMAALKTKVQDEIDSLRAEALADRQDAADLMAKAEAMAKEYASKLSELGAIVNRGAR